MMGLIFERALEGATLGGVLGTAIGGILTATATVVFAPVTIPALVIAAAGTVVTVGTAGEIGTLVGGGIGVVSGTVESLQES